MRWGFPVFEEVRLVHLRLGVKPKERMYTCIPYQYGKAEAPLGKGAVAGFYRFSVRLRKRLQRWCGLVREINRPVEDPAHVHRRGDTADRGIGYRWQRVTEGIREPRKSPFDICGTRCAVPSDFPVGIRPREIYLFKPRYVQLMMLAIQG